MTYQFRPLEREDYPLLRSWLAQPHIGGWWGPADTEIALIDEDFGQDYIAMWIVTLDGAPFAYGQDYSAFHWEMPQYADLPETARALDTFLGDPAFLGQGHATGYLRTRARQLIAEGADIVAVDPDPANTRAVAAYARAGFVKAQIAPGEDGDLVQVMTFGAPQAAAHS